MSAIEWTEKTWNPIVGCTRIAKGCEHCYAETMAKRLAAMGVEQYKGLLDDHGRWNGTVRFVESALDKPLRTKKPTMWFVNSMSDLFHEDVVKTDWIDRILAVIKKTPHHTYQVLTKRPDLMAEYFTWEHGPQYGKPMPRNLWLGTSVSTQADADANIPWLLKCPAAVRFVSAEPLLAGIELSQALACNNTGVLNQADTGGRYLATFPGIDWVIVGGESGPGARPCNVDWIRDIVGQCKAAQVPVFVKQLGAHYVDAQNGIGGVLAKPPREYGALTRRLRSRKGANMAEWPEDLRVREIPEVLP